VKEGPGNKATDYANCDNQFVENMLNEYHHQIMYLKGKIISVVGLLTSADEINELK
jgi:hypothetical protein